VWQVTRNEDVNEKMIRELKDEIEKLRQQLVRHHSETLGDVEFLSSTHVKLLTDLVWHLSNDGRCWV
jgi:uncharacterized membrane-anchored protein YhcB (DUF1043 family)